MNHFSVKNFESFQHYKDRTPPWIKLYNCTLEDYEIASLPDVSKAHLFAIWLLASRSHNKIPYDARFVGNKINATEPVDLDLLVQSGFIVIDQGCNNMLAESKQDDIPEREERRGEREVEKKVLTSSVDDTRLMVDSWNRMASDYGLTKVQKLTKARKAKAVARLKDCGGLEGWDAALEKVAKTPGLLGQAGGNWKASFDFLLQESSFVKLMEGSYDNWTDTRRGGGVDVVAQALSEIETERNGT